MAMKKRKLIPLINNIIPTPEQDLPNRINFKFLTKEQEDAWKILENNDIAFMTGSAGTGKSFLILAYCLQKILEGQCEKLYLCKPAIGAFGDLEKLGAAPGTILEKTAYFYSSLYVIIDSLTGNDKRLKKYIQEKVDILPLSFIRGITLGEGTYMVLDEAQNINLIGLKSLLSRIGKGAKILASGDNTQCDLPTSRISGLREVMNKLQNIEGIGFFEFTEEAIVRHPLVKEILKRLK